MCAMVEPDIVHDVEAKYSSTPLWIQTQKICREYHSAGVSLPTDDDGKVIGKLPPYISRTPSGFRIRVRLSMKHHPYAIHGQHARQLCYVSCSSYKGCCQLRVIYSVLVFALSCAVTTNEVCRGVLRVPLSLYILGRAHSKPQLTWGGFCHSAPYLHPWKRYTKLCMAITLRTVLPASLHLCLLELCNMFSCLNTACVQSYGGTWYPGYPQCCHLLVLLPATNPFLVTGYYEDIANGQGNVNMG